MKNSRKKQKKKFKRKNKNNVCTANILMFHWAELSIDVHICSMCLLSDINPFSKILMKLRTMEYKCSGREGAKTCKNFILDNADNKYLEIRCIAMNKLGICEISFPIFCTLLINGQKIKEIKPLNANSSLKKRKDSSIIVSLKDLQKQNNFYRKLNLTCIEHTSDQNCRKDQIGAQYYFGLFLVENQNVQQVIEKIEILNYKLLIDPREQQDEIQIDKFKVSLVCQFSLELIKIPAKGEFCLHSQCFCLNSYLEMMYRTEHRKWICPICRKVSLHLLIDKNQQFIIDRIKQLELQVDSVILDKNGQLDKVKEPLSRIILDRNITKHSDIIEQGHRPISKIIQKDQKKEVRKVANGVQGIMLMVD